MICEALSMKTTSFSAMAGNGGFSTKSTHSGWH